jgi:hypothetical protein
MNFRTAETIFMNLGIYIVAPEPFRRLPTASVVLATDPEVQVRFPALRDYLTISGSGTGSTQPREYN